MDSRHAGSGLLLLQHSLIVRDSDGRNTACCQHTRCIRRLMMEVW